MRKQTKEHLTDRPADGGVHVRLRAAEANGASAWELAT
jgi:hypothetical protein